MTGRKDCPEPGNGCHCSPQCCCPHGWSTVHPDLTAAGNRSPSHRAWTRSDTDPSCPEHGTGRKTR